MESCSSSLSRDGILCELCRQCFDSTLVDSKLLQGDSATNKKKFYLWHDISGLKRCASQQCRFCSLILANWNDGGIYIWDQYDQTGLNIFAKVASWGGRLAILRQDAESLVSLISINYPYYLCQVDAENSGAEFSYSTSRFGNFRKIFEVELKAITESNSVSTYEISGDSTGSEATLERIQAWVVDCEKHPTCIEWSSMIGISPALPNRMLELRTGSEDPKIRLVLRDQLPVEGCRRYATLSHCWGGNLPITLLQQNLQKYCTDIPWEILPRTFQEAISMALKLNISYLWIDALCIIQDSHDDWVREAALMADVYANCYVNISADASKNGDGGLYKERDPRAHRSFTVSGPKSDVEFRACCYKDRSYTDVYTSNTARGLAPLKGRAWVVQERFLAPRVIHFFASQVYWECTQLMTSESIPLKYAEHDRKFPLCSELPHGSPQRAEALRQRYTLWCDLRSDYSKAKLSFSTDRPAAIAGLARTFCPLLGLQASDYHCGLWRTWFIQDIMWGIYERHSDGSGPKSRIDTCTPSWSWLSMDRMQFWDSARDDWHPLAELLNVTTVPLNNPFGSVVSGHAKIRGPLCQATISKSPSCFEKHHSECWCCDQFLKLGQHVLTHGPSIKDFFSSSDLNRDFNFNSKSELTVYLLLVGGDVTSDNATNSYFQLAEYHCLVLLPADNPGSFRRIGCMTVVPYGNRKAKEEKKSNNFEGFDKYIRSYTIPKHLYEEVDKEFMYTFTFV